MEKLRSIAGVVIGIGLIIGGIVTLTDDKVMCGSQEMTSTSQVCEETSDSGSTTTRTMSEQRDDNKMTGWLLLGFGVVMIGGGIWWARSAFGAGKAAPAQAAGMPPGPQPPQPQPYAQWGAPPQYGPPPQGQYGPPQQQWGQPRR